MEWPVLQGRLRVETNALLRKSWAIQKKNGCSNCCLLSAPIVVCFFLFAIQRLIDNAIEDDPDSKVPMGLGCQLMLWGYVT